MTAPAAPVPRARDTRGRLWPAAVAVILSITAGANFWLLDVAKRDPSMVVEPDYYRKAVRWDAEMAQARRNVTLGWRLTPALGAVTAGGTAPLRVSLAGAAGRPLPGARVTVDAFAVARSGDQARYALRATDASDTAFVADLRVPTLGRWELRFTVERAGAGGAVERFTHVARVDAR